MSTHIPTTITDDNLLSHGAMTLGKLLRTKKQQNGVFPDGFWIKN